MQTVEDLEKIAVANFRTYLQFSTVHPQPDYGPTIKWLQSLAKELDLVCSVTELYLGNPILVMCWKGSNPGLPAILLNSHMDVVPVDETKWTYPPFDAQISADNKIYARGSQDMKCVGIQQLEAVRRLKHRGLVQPKRTIYISFVPDEELGGSLGMRPFVEGVQPASPNSPNEVKFADLNIGLCLDEGIASPSDDYLAFYDERRPCWFRAHFNGVAGHGSTIPDGTAGEKLQGFLDRIMGFRAQEKARLDQSNGQLTLGDVTSVNLTVINGGLQHNVLPSVLSVSFDVRLTPSLSLDAWKDRLNKWAEEVGGGVEFEYVNTGYKFWHPAPVPDERIDPYWGALFNVCQKFNVKVHTRVFSGATDARFVRQFHRMPTAPAGAKPIQAIGFSPMRRTPVLLHDHDEYLSVDEFLHGCKVYTELINSILQVD